jgi:hypothetical protein
MYTIEMAKAFKAIKPPKNFGVIIYDNDDFVTIKINPEKLLDLTDKQAENIAEYLNKVKKTFENFGAIVFVVRDTLENKDESN